MNENDADIKIIYTSSRDLPHPDDTDADVIIYVPPTTKSDDDE